MAEKKKILLIYPPAPIMNREDRCQQPVQNPLVVYPLPPTDLMYMAAVAEEITEPFYYEPKIVDYSLTKGNAFDAFKEDLKEFKPDFLVVNIASTRLKEDLLVLDVAKEILPEITTIVKGALFLTSNTDVLYDYKSLDLIMVGEVEETFKEILEEVPLHDIKGLCYRDGFVAKFTGARSFVEDLDDLPFPARHLVNNSLYRRPDNNKIQAVIKVSRGCPHHCFFCLATPVSGSEVRMRSVDNIVEEIKECIDSYGIKNFLFLSDLFNADREWVLDLCEKIIDSDIDIFWSANVRADNVDEEMVELMYDAGCSLVTIGVESGSQYILDKIGKTITIDQVIDTVKMFREMGIKVYNYFVIGLPWDNENTIEDTIEFAMLLNTDFVSFYTATPLLGSRYYKFAIENHLLTGGESFEDAYYKPVVDTLCITKERVFELQKQAVKRYYLRTRYIFKAISNIRSFAELKNYVKAGLLIALKK